MMLRGGAQNGRSMRQFILRMGRHYASDCRPHVADPGVADLQNAAQPSIFDEFAGLISGIDQDVGAKAPRVEVGLPALQTAQMPQRAGSEQMKRTFVIEFPLRQERIAPLNRGEVLGCDVRLTRALQTYRMLEQGGETL